MPALNEVSRKLLAMGLIHSGNTRWVPVFNGVNTRLLIPDFNINRSFYIECKLNLPDLTDHASIFHAKDSAAVLWCRVLINRTVLIRYQSLAGDIPYLKFVDVSVPFNQTTKLRVEYTGTEMIVSVNGIESRLACLDADFESKYLSDFGIKSSSSSPLEGQLFDIDVNGERFYPLNEGHIENGMALDTQSGKHGTYYNFTANDFSKVTA